MTEPSADVRRAPDLAWVEEDDRIAIVRLACLDRPVIVLTAVAAIIWRALDEVDTREALIALLVSEYDAPRDEIASDVDTWLVSAEQEGILAGPSTRGDEATPGPHHGRSVHDVDSE